jgi:hypothetical protein
MLLISSTASAQPIDYTCEVKQTSTLDDFGLLKTKTIYDHLLGKSFVVNRVTGVISGDVFLKTSNYKKVTLISDGNQSNDFRVVAVGGAPTSITTFLYVRATAKQRDKPFILVDSSFLELTISGTCR